MQISIWTPSAIPCWSFNNTQVQKLRKALPEASVIHCQNAEEFKEALLETDVAIVNVFKQKWFDLAPHLKWLAVPTAGKDYFTIEPPAELLVTYGSFHGQIMAETVVGMILASCRGLLYTKEIQSTEKWTREIIASKIKRIN
ncbi:MAG: hypothetical protein MJB14_12320, partial [Spirochaetes bacterium]|nr:hypothetical protein [Spirochaetota bacterium]